MSKMLCGRIIAQLKPLSPSLSRKGVLFFYSYAETMDAPSPNSYVRCQVWRASVVGA
jgi:hypothetical protein